MAVGARHRPAEAYFLSWSGDRRSSYGFVSWGNARFLKLVFVVYWPSWRFGFSSLQIE